MRDFPNATLYSHPLTLKRVCQPKDICNHMKKVLFARYDQEFSNLVLPISERRCHELKDNEIINFGKFMDVQTMYSPGHCADHVVYFDKRDSIIFTGDAFGNQYKEITRPIFSCPFLFDAYTGEKSIQRIMNSGAKYAALAHYSFINNVKEFGEKSSEWLSKMWDIAINGKATKFEVYNEYATAFGSDFIKSHAIRGHYHTNVMGVDSIHKFTHGLFDTKRRYLIN
jgi:glyoxylase-like metal-dependent hydrolase (beta-lactamase superfamily II)